MGVWESGAGVVQRGAPARRRLRLERRGVALSVVDWGGEGPLALLSHANGFCADSLGLVAEVLRADYRVIGFDSRGHGDSSQPEPPAAYRWEEFVADVAAVARVLPAELSLPDVALGVGHSFGGTCMIAAAARDPGLFGRLVALDPVIVPPPEERVGYYAGEAQHPMAEVARKRVHVFDSRAAVRARWRERGTFADWDPRALELYLAHGFRDLPDGSVELKCPGEVEAAVYEASLGFDLFREVAALRTPTKILFAEQGDRPRSVVEKLVARSASFSLEPIPAGHLLPMIAPDRVAAEILKSEA